MAKVRVKGTISTGRRKNFTELPDDIASFIDSIGFDEASLVGKDLLQNTADRLPILTGRLRSSGFFYLNGNIQSVSTYVGGGPITPPDPPVRLSLSGFNQYAIDIIFHTPKPASQNANVYYTWRGGLWFDYSRLYVDRVTKWFVSGKAAEQVKRANKLIHESISKKAKRIFG
jgi:hypothetical protein